MSYLCNRNRETKIANDKVPWMSGLVSGLQNRVRRFESARNLKQKGELEKSNSPFCLEWFASLINSEISLVQCKYSIQNNKKKLRLYLEILCLNCPTFILMN